MIDLDILKVDEPELREANVTARMRDFVRRAVEACFAQNPQRVSLHGILITTTVNLDFAGFIVGARVQGTVQPNRVRAQLPTPRRYAVPVTHKWEAMEVR